jgi:hypothetical protein
MRMPAATTSGSSRTTSRVESSRDGRFRCGMQMTTCTRSSSEGGGALRVAGACVSRIRESARCGSGAPWAFAGRRGASSLRPARDREFVSLRGHSRVDLRRSLMRMPSGFLHRFTSCRGVQCTGWTGLARCFRLVRVRRPA